MESKLEEKSQTSRTTYVYGLDRQYAWLPAEKVPPSSETHHYLHIALQMCWKLKEFIQVIQILHFFFQSDNNTGSRMHVHITSVLILLTRAE